MTVIALLAVIRVWGRRMVTAMWRLFRPQGLTLRLLVLLVVVAVAVATTVVAAPVIARLAAPVLQGRTSVVIWGNSTAGTTVTLGHGTYTIRYKSGAYSTYAVGADPGFSTWLTAVFVFNGSPRFLDDGRIDESAVLYRLADFKYWPSEQEAEARAAGFQTEVFIDQPERLTFVAVDYRSAYGDNPGKVVLEIQHAG